MTEARHALEDLLPLLKAGYHIVEIHTTSEEMKLLLGKGPIHVTLTLGRHDALRILQETDLFAHIRS
ncbi:MAG: hypothetical protein ACYDDF_00805 [Thermoplasmatota archaeon]